MKQKQEDLIFEMMDLQYALLRVAERPITVKESEKTCGSKTIHTAPRV